MSFTLQGLTLSSVLRNQPRAGPVESSRRKGYGHCSHKSWTAKEVRPKPKQIMIHAVRGGKKVQ